MFSFCSCLFSDGNHCNRQTNRHKGGLMSQEGLSSNYLWEWVSLRIYRCIFLIFLGCVCVTARPTEVDPLNCKPQLRIILESEFGARSAVCSSVPGRNTPASPSVTMCLPFFLGQIGARTNGRHILFFEFKILDENLEAPRGRGPCKVHSETVTQISWNSPSPTRGIVAQN